MASSDFTQNKLILLYILREKGCISRSDLSDFVLYKYMDYFSLDQYLLELEETGLLMSINDNGKISYRITEPGLETLDLFQLRIPHSIRREILEYAEIEALERSSTMGLDVSVVQQTDGRFTVTCYVRDYDTHLFELSFHVSTQAEAAHLRSQWLKKGLGLYRNLIHDLNSDEEPEENA